MMSKNEYTSRVGLAQRKRFAQFFTPTKIAKFMVDWVLDGRLKGAVHDPAFGLGAFWRETPADRDFSGSDVDETVLAFFMEKVPGARVRLECKDYLLSFDGKFDNVVCNPPYLRFQKFLNRDAVLRTLAERLGVRFSGYTNIASAFLVKSVFELNDDGRLAYILPSEFLNAGYGETVKDVLLRDKCLDSIIKVECEQDAFDEVITSVCIVLYEKNRRHDVVSFRRVSRLEQFDTILDEEPVNAVDADSLNPKDKWERYFCDGGGDCIPNQELLCGLECYGRFSRGIATGANEFFVLSKSEIAANGLSSASCLPCITKSQQIRDVFFSDRDFAELADADAPVYLFSPGSEPDETSMRYIREGERKGYDKRFITSHRSPWYKTESRTAAPLMLNVFSRGGYKVVRNFSAALSLTNFHCFFPNWFGNSYIDWLFVYLHSGIGRKVLSLSKRQYGDSLDKFEPNDLNSALVPKASYFDSLGTEKLQSVLSTLRAGKNADAFFEELFKPLVLEAGSDVPKQAYRRPPRTEQMLLAVERREAEFSVAQKDKGRRGKVYSEKVSRVARRVK